MAFKHPRGESCTAAKSKSEKIHPKVNGLFSSEGKCNIVTCGSAAVLFLGLPFENGKWRFITFVLFNAHVASGG